jgi:LPXTG-motif cell wall-anchored protein
VTPTPTATSTPPVILPDEDEDDDVIAGVSTSVPPSALPATGMGATETILGLGGAALLVTGLVLLLRRRLT